MSRDINLDTSSHDINLSKGITLTKSGIETLAQNVKVALLLRTTEWAPNINAGVPYLATIFRGKNNKSFVDSYFQSYIEAIPGVGRLSAYSSELDAQRRLNIKFTALSEQQTIEVTI